STARTASRWSLSRPEARSGFPTTITPLGERGVGPARASWLGVRALARPTEPVVEADPGTDSRARVRRAFAPDDPGSSLAPVRVTILASGSGGNATLVQAGGTRILIDAGVGPAVVRTRMQRALGRPFGEDAPRIDAIVTTHAHGDHIGKVVSCASSFGAPIYM